MEGSRLLLGVIKHALKKRKITYKKLASHLGVTEAGIKKMFSSSDLPVSRLLKICDILETSPENLFKAMKNQPVKRVRFNKEQTTWFLRHPDYFYFYLKLIYEECSIDELAEDTSLSKKSIWKYARKLDELGLIELGPGDKIKFDKGFPVFVDTRGIPEFEKIRVETAFKFAEKVSSESTTSNNIRMSGYRLSGEQIENLREDIFKIMEKYKRVSQIEKVYDPRGLQKFSALVYFGDYSFIPPIRNI